MTLKRAPLHPSSKPLRRRSRPLRRVSENRAQRQAEARPVKDWVMYERDRRCLLFFLSDGCRGGLSPHHLRKQSQAHDDTPENMVALCCYHNDRLEASAEFAAWAHERGLVCKRTDSLADCWARMRRHGLVTYNWRGEQV